MVSTEPCGVWQPPVQIDEILSASGCMIIYIKLCEMQHPWWTKIFPYVAYTGTCRWTGYVFFFASLAWTGYIFLGEIVITG